MNAVLASIISLLCSESRSRCAVCDYSPSHRQFHLAAWSCHHSPTWPALKAGNYFLNPRHNNNIWPLCSTDLSRLDLDHAVSLRRPLDSLFCSQSDWIKGELSPMLRVTRCGMGYEHLRALYTWTWIDIDML